MLFSELQNKMCDLMVELDELLRKNDIKYMLYCGSQLGADRHHGMIPWDDDIDIMMSLDNYDKFIEVARKGLPEGRAVNALELSEQYPFCYARYVDTTTTALQKHTLFGGCDPGVKIDVFFCVPTHSNEKKARQHQLEILAFNEVLVDNITMIYRRPEEFFPYYEKEKKLFEKLGREEYVRKRLPQLKYKYTGPFRKPQKYIFFSGMAGNSHFFDATEITNTKEIDYEGHIFCAAANGPYYDIESYDESWYQIPGDIKKPHHTWAADIYTPYSKHLELIGDYLDLEKMHTVQRRRKQLKLEEQVRFKEAIVLRTQLKNLAVGMSVENQYRSTPDNAALPELFDIFIPYYKTQLNRDNRWYSLIVPLPDDILADALYCLVSMGDFAKAINILNILGVKKPENYNYLQKQIELSRELIYAIYVYPEQLESKASLIEQNSSTVNLSIPEGRGRLLLQKMRNTDEPDRRISLAKDIIATVDESISVYGPRSELQILKAFAVKELELLEANYNGIPSSTLFNMDADNITNGFILQEILDEGFDILHSDAESNADDEEESTGESQNGLMHYYLEKEDYDRKKRDFEKNSNLCDYAEKGKGDNEYLVQYQRGTLAASYQSTLKRKTGDMCKRTFWHLCGAGESRAEIKKVPIIAEGVSPEEYILRADEAGLLSEKNIKLNEEYRRWIKDEYSDVNAQFNRFGKEFEQYMSRSE